MEEIWNLLNLTRIYTKKRGQFPNLEECLIMRGKTKTIEAVCNQIHRNLKKDFKEAYVWGRSAKHQPQRVGLSHQVSDEDVV